ncbi:hypothetical protein AADZ90_004595 [Aestuariibius sp. 2305UL40-4]|uniref:hypothetical protein n=1 Tax=Aestuariibius violaceus TaxID=3234132 RepID=UPI00345E1CED
MILRSICAAILTVFAIPATAAEIGGVCFANAWESCYITIDGPITPDTAAEFEAAAKTADGGTVLLTSSGGDPAGAIALGRTIRQLGLSTQIGRTEGGEPGPGECRDACLYAFLGGGEARLAAEGSEITFQWQPLVPDDPGPSSAVMATAYVIEMGADPAFLLRDDPSRPMSSEELGRHGITHVVERAFGPFTIEPYRDGIVAASKRLDDPHPYDRAIQLTAYCRDEKAHFLLTGVGAFVADSGDASVSYWTDKADGQSPAETKIEIADYRTWIGDKNSFIELSFDPDHMRDVEDIATLDVTFRMARVSGGTQWVRRDLTAMDRRMLRAAFTHCIRSPATP